MLPNRVILQVLRLAKRECNLDAGDDELLRIGHLGLEQGSHCETSGGLATAMLHHWYSYVCCPSTAVIPWFV